jgi:hypothetical protein
VQLPNFSAQIPSRVCPGVTFTKSAESVHCGVLSLNKGEVCGRSRDTGVFVCTEGGWAAGKAVREGGSAEGTGAGVSTVAESGGSEAIETGGSAAVGAGVGGTYAAAVGCAAAG